MVEFAIRTQMEAELDGVDLDEVEVETKDRGDEKDDDVAGEYEKEGGAPDDVLVDLISPFALEEEEWTENEGADDAGEESNSDEAP